MTFDPDEGMAKAERPVAILSENSLEHALLALGEAAEHLALALLGLGKGLQVRHLAVQLERLVATYLGV